MGRAPALPRHHHRLGQLTPDLCQQTAEHVNTCLPLEFPQIDVEVGLIGRHDSAYREYSGTGRTLSSASCVSGPDRAKLASPRPRHRGTKMSGSVPMRSGSKKFLTSSQRRSSMPPCCLVSAESAGRCLRFTATSGSGVAPAGLPICRGDGLAGAGVSARRASTVSGAPWVPSPPGQRPMPPRGPASFSRPYRPRCRPHN